MTSRRVTLISVLRKELFENRAKAGAGLAKPLAAIVAFAIGALAMTAAPATADQLTPAEARAIAKEATIYGFPLVDNYRVQYSYFVDRGGDQYKAPWNTLVNNARVYTPADTAIQTPNSDTPYSFIGADLRAEPLVFSVPAIDKDRYYSLQFIDMYTFNFAYVGSRATGDDAGAYLLAGPDWHGETPPGVKAVIRSETEFAFVIYRTQLFGPDDIDNVKKIQAGYKVQPLSQFLGKPAPPAPPAVDFIKPLSPEAERTSPEFFNILNFVLGFCPPNPAETEIMARFAKLGIGPHGTFDAKALSPEMLKAVQDGMADAWADVQGRTRKRSSTPANAPALTRSARANFSTATISPASRAPSLASTAIRRTRRSIRSISSTAPRSRSPGRTATSCASRRATCLRSTPSGR